MKIEKESGSAVCDFCRDRHCLQCDPKNAKICSKCQEGFFISETKKCERISDSVTFQQFLSVMIISLSIMVVLVLVIIIPLFFMNKGNEKKKMEMRMRLRNRSVMNLSLITKFKLSRCKDSVEFGSFFVVFS